MFLEECTASPSTVFKLTVTKISMLDVVSVKGFKSIKEILSHLYGRTLYVFCMSLDTNRNASLLKRAYRRLR